MPCTRRHSLKTHDGLPMWLTIYCRSLTRLRLCANNEFNCSVYLSSSVVYCQLYVLKNKCYIEMLCINECCLKNRYGFLDIAAAVIVINASSMIVNSKFVKMCLLACPRGLTRELTVSSLRPSSWKYRGKAGSKGRRRRRERREERREVQLIAWTFISKITCSLCTRMLNTAQAHSVWLNTKHQSVTV